MTKIDKYFIKKFLIYLIKIIGIIGACYVAKNVVELIVTNIN